MTPADRWLAAWLDRWAPRMGAAAVLFGAGALVVGWIHGGVL